MSAVVVLLCCHGFAVLAQNVTGFGQPHQANVAQAHAASSCNLEGHANASALNDAVDADDGDVAAGRHDIQILVFRSEAPLELAVTALPSAPPGRPMRPPQPLAFFA